MQRKAAKCTSMMQRRCGAGRPHEQPSEPLASQAYLLRVFNSAQVTPAELRVVAADEPQSVVMPLRRLWRRVRVTLHSRQELPLPYGLRVLARHKGIGVVVASGVTGETEADDYEVGEEGGVATARAEEASHPPGHIPRPHPMPHPCRIPCRISTPPDPTPLLLLLHPGCSSLRTRLTPAIPHHSCPACPIAPTPSNTNPTQPNSNPTPPPTRRAASSQRQQTLAARFSSTAWTSRSCPPPPPAGPSTTGETRPATPTGRPCDRPSQRWRATQTCTSRCDPSNYLTN